MKIFSFAFKRSVFSTTELFDLGNRLDTTAGETVSKSPGGEVVARALKAALGTMVSMTERDKSNPVTAKIHEKDSARDDCLLMIRDAIKSNTHNVTDTKAREDASVLFKVYTRHIKAISRMGFGAETKAIKHLVEEMTDAENKERCDRIHITPLIATLVQIQAELEALYVERTRIAPVPGESTLKQTHQSLQKAVSRFLGYIDVMIAADEQGTAALANEITRILTEVEAIARARKTRLGHNEPEQPELPAQPIVKAA
jgi:DNA-binding MarR family transcriptional regulator